MYGKRFVTIIALALAGVAFLAVGAQAATVNASWVGGTAGSLYDWNTAANRNQRFVSNNKTSSPTGSGTNLINSGTYTPVTLYTLSPTVGSLSIAAGYGLNIAGNNTLALSTGESLSGLIHQRW